MPRAVLWSTRSLSFARQGSDLMAPTQCLLLPSAYPFLYYYLRDLEEKRTHFAAIVAVMHELALVSMTLSHNGKFLIPNLKLFEYKVFHFLIIIRRIPAFTYHDLHIGGLRLRPGCSTNFLTGCDQGSECIVCL